MKKRIPIFRKILFPLMFLTVAEILILVLALFAQGLLTTLNQNEKDVLYSQVEARKNFLEGLMVNDWMQLDDAVEQVVGITERYMEEAHVSVSRLDDSAKDISPLLTEMTEPLIYLMRENRVTGVYLIFNTDELAENGAIQRKPGIYIRDPDPTSLASEQNEDLFLKISPKDVLANTAIPTDTGWDIYFRFEGENGKFTDILRIPFTTAYNSGSKYTWKDMGFWNIAQDNDRYEEPILTYTVPLILSDGTVIGVMGVDLTFRYLSTILPYSELGFENNGAYVIARYDHEADRYYNIFGSGNMEGLDLWAETGLQMDEKHYICARSLHLYESNTPFSEEEWVVAGVVGTQYMQSFARKLVVAAFIAIGIALLVGVLVSLAISYWLQRPIAQIANEISSADSKSKLKLTPTGFMEIDAMSDEIIKLSDDLLESGRKFSKIIEMSSVRMSGFQINRAANTLFLTEDFFAVFGEKDMDQTSMTVESFNRAMEKYRTHVVEEGDGCHLLKIPIDGQYRYIQLRVHTMDSLVYGLVEDVTKEILEKQLLQHERDHDPLTNIYNRRAFRVKLEELFASPKELKCAALIMIDLDNLKYFNDTFGHECGDRYIICAAKAIKEAMPEGAICARISGDEFNIFLYGYSSQAEIMEQVEIIQRVVNSGMIPLPDGTSQYVHATGGVAFYPEHSRTIEGLSKLADYAMYVAKRNHKRSFERFDSELFHSQDIQLRNSEALTKMLQYGLVHYAFQPIVDARTGEIFAYEALMRPDVDKFFTVFDVLETARRDGKLCQVEEMTLFKSLETFDEYIQHGDIPENTHLFVNSISNQCVSVEKGELFVEKYGKYGKQLVLELTEEEKIDKEIWGVKEYHHRILGGKVALDDYGSGYNNEITLLELSPDYIKVDMAIIRNIQTDKNKQQIVENIVRYAHDRAKFIIAEGVENEAEVKQLMELEVDYMQGYFFGKPQTAPQKISPEARKALGIG